jgi:hypothetical protein
MFPGRAAKVIRIVALRSERIQQSGEIAHELDRPLTVWYRFSRKSRISFAISSGFCTGALWPTPAQR